MIFTALSFLRIIYGLFFVRRHFQLVGLYAINVNIYAWNFYGL